MIESAKSKKTSGIRNKLRKVTAFNQSVKIEICMTKTIAKKTLIAKQKNVSLIGPSKDTNKKKLVMARNK